MLFPQPELLVLRLLGWISRTIPLTHAMTSGLKACLTWRPRFGSMDSGR